MREDEELTAAEIVAIAQDRAALDKKFETPDTEPSAESVAVPNARKRESSPKLDEYDESTERKRFRNLMAGRAATEDAAVAAEPTAQPKESAQQEAQAKAKAEAEAAARQTKADLLSRQAQQEENARLRYKNNAENDRANENNKKKDKATEEAHLPKSFFGSVFSFVKNVIMSAVEKIGDALADAGTAAAVAYRAEKARQSAEAEGLPPPSKHQKAENDASKAETMAEIKASKEMRDKTNDDFAAARAIKSDLAAREQAKANQAPADNNVARPSARQPAANQTPDEALRARHSQAQDKFHATPGESKEREQARVELAPLEAQLARKIIEKFPPREVAQERAPNADAGGFYPTLPKPNPLSGARPQPKDEHTADDTQRPRSPSSRF